MVSLAVLSLVTLCGVGATLAQQYPAGPPESLATLPDHLDFNCAPDQLGFYADVERECQIFHVCQGDGRVDSYFCPNQTLFNQKYLVCDWWYNVDCAGSPNYYGVNEQLLAFKGSKNPYGPSLPSIVSPSYVGVPARAVAKPIHALPAASVSHPSYQPAPAAHLASSYNPSPSYNAAGGSNKYGSNNDLYSSGSSGYKAASSNGSPSAYKPASPPGYKAYKPAPYSASSSGGYSSGSGSSKQPQYGTPKPSYGKPSYAASNGPLYNALNNNKEYAAATPRPGPSYESPASYGSDLPSYASKASQVPSSAYAAAAPSSAYGDSKPVYGGGSASYNAGTPAPAYQGYTDDASDPEPEDIADPEYDADAADPEFRPIDN